MNRRARLLGAGCAIGLSCGALVVASWRHRAIESGAGRESRAVRTSSEGLPPIQEVPSAAPPHRTRSEPAVASPPPAAVALPSKASSGIGFEEEELMRVLRNARRNDPALAVALAREGNRRFPESSAAPERASILIHALAEQGLSSEARGEAEDMVNRYPDSAWVHEVERFTGARRHRNIRVGPDGELHYVDPAPPT